MKFDSVIIGGGLAGLVCGIRLSKAGRRCAIISSGQSALHFSSGSFDLLGALPDGTPVAAPAESVAETIRQAPEHPYARIGAERFGALAAEAAALLAENDSNARIVWSDRKPQRRRRRRNGLNVRAASVRIVQNALNVRNGPNGLNASNVPIGRIAKTAAAAASRLSSSRRMSRRKNSP